MSGLDVELGPELNPTSTAAPNSGPDAGVNTDTHTTLYQWPREPGHTTTLRSDLSWSLTELGTPSVRARDLLRVVTAAYLADKSASQPPVTLARQLRLTVHLEEPDVWTEQVKEQLVDLLHWLTGDEWALRCVLAHREAITTTRPLDVPIADDIVLLSGGLDSFCGALLRIRQPGRVRFLGHAETATAVRRAQQRLQAHFEADTPPRMYEQYALRPKGQAHHATPKTRSLLFVAMAVAAATGTGAQRVLVPENGFTSINPPLEPSRGGVLTTRSTHPWTFHSIIGLLQELELNVSVENPHAHLTKGELVKQALETAPTELVTLAAQTVSCAKINAGRPKGGDANTQCGLCIACLVRRAAFLAAGVIDHTPYTGTGSSHLARQVQQIRRHDTNAWRTAITAGIPEHRILGAGMWPPNTDFDAVFALCHRGLKELSRVPY